MEMTSSSVFERVRERFPALRAASQREVFFDNAAGAQVPDEVVDAVREHYAKRPYVEDGASFDDYAPAYRYGVETVRRHGEAPFEEVEAKLREEWVRARGDSRLDWDKAKHPVRDAWEWVKTDIDHD